MANTLQPPIGFSQVSLAHGLFQVEIPSDWVLEDDFPFATVFRLPDGGKMTMRALVHDNPEIEAEGDYASLLLDILDSSEHDNLYRLLEKWIEVPGLPTLTLSARQQAADGGWYRNVWRSLEARPPFYRTVTWQFEPGSKADGAALAAYADALHERFQGIAFADSETDLDRVAATPDLKVASFGNSVILRMPVEWQRKRENDDGTGRHCIDEPNLDRWTLWVDWEQLANGDDSEAALSADDLASTLTGVNDRFATDDGDQVLVQEFVADEDPPLRITGWHRVGRRGRHVVLAHFSFVVDEAQAELPELVAVRDLIGREAQRALLIPRPSRP